jgi:hypothetical protein
MDFVTRALDDIRHQIAAADASLSEARTRRDLVLKYAATFKGTLRTFNSGSLAHLTVNSPVSDADCGDVLDRRTYPELGPDGGGEGPTELLEALRDHIGPLIRVEYPNAKLTITKRAILIRFHAPLLSGEDPTVDLIVALNRDEPGIYIPNTDTDSWDASHPEKHTDLLTGGNDALKRVRRRAIRLGKAWNKQWDKPGVSSFNLEALALAAVKDGMDEAHALLAVFTHAASELARHNTPDPAEVSKPIKLLHDRDIVVRRFCDARDQLKRAIDAEDEASARVDLCTLFRNYEVIAAVESKAALVGALRAGAPLSVGRFISTERTATAYDRPAKSVHSSAGSAPTTSASSTAAAWFDVVVERTFFERGLSVAYPNFEGRASTLRGARTRSYAGWVDLPHYRGQGIEIVFDGQRPRDYPKIFVAEPGWKHRYGDGTLCVWERSHPESMRWVWADGLVTLIDAVRVHLFREAYWRETGEWPGPEVVHEERRSARTRRLN